MITLTASANRCCDGTTRRDFLRVAGLGAAGLTVHDLLRMRSAHARARSAALTAKGRGETTSSFGRAKRVIILFMFGGPPQQDTFDLKPEAPKEIRGEFSPVSTNVPGIQISEHLPLLSRRADKFAIVRSVTHPSNAHSASAHHMLTGNIHPNPAGENLEPRPNDYPHIGSVLTKLRSDECRVTSVERRQRNPSFLDTRHSSLATQKLPTFVALPWKVHNTGGQVWPGQGGGFMGAQYDPFRINVEYPRLHDDPKAYEHIDFRVADLELPRGMSLARLQSRRSLRELVNHATRHLNDHFAVRSHDAFYEHALDLVTSPAAQRAFDLTREPASMRERYGPNLFGQGALLARRLIEAGVPLVTVYWQQDGTNEAPAWDTHANNFKILKGRLLPPTDRALSALLDDLAASGLLDETLVVWMGEFGRTPKVNPRGGRDHWGACQSVVIAGAGVRGGQVYGSSDGQAAYPASDPVSPGDLATTIYHLLGIDADTEIRDQLNRPVPVARGRVVSELF